MMYLLPLLTTITTVFLMFEKSCNKAMVSLMWVTLMVFFLTDNIVLFFLSFEIVLPIISIIIFAWGYQNEKLSAVKWMMVMTLMSSMSFFIILLIMETHWMPTYMYLSTSTMTWIMLIPFFMKMPLFFMHFWLIRAHVESPTYGSILLAALLLKVGGWGAIRVMELVAFDMSRLVPVVMLFGLYGAMSACWSFDSKVVVALFSVAHMNYFLGALFSNGMLGDKVMVLLMCYHGFASTALFYMVGSSFYSTSTRMMVLLKGNYIMCTLNMLSNISLPPYFGIIGDVWSFILSYAFFPITLLMMGFYLLVIAYMSMEMAHAGKHKTDKDSIMYTPLWLCMLNVAFIDLI